MGGAIVKRAVLYLRVSTVEQTTANQERELREVASRIGSTWHSLAAFKSNIDSRTRSETHDRFQDPGAD
jgi:DNA invertase Pin-like site-specific DNA recombinase